MLKIAELACLRGTDQGGRLRRQNVRGPGRGWRFNRVRCERFFIPASRRGNLATCTVERKGNPDMLRTRDLFSLLLFGALLLPQAPRAGASECAGVGPAGGMAFMSAAAHPTSGVHADCRSHHPGTNPRPIGMQHCAVSLDCVSSPALPVAGPDSHEVPAVVTVRVRIQHLPASNSPEPQTPPPRA